MSSMKNFIPNLLTTIHISQSFQDTFWLIGHFLTFISLIRYIFTSNIAISIPYVSTFVKLIIFDCSQSDLNPLFNMIFLLNLAYLYGVLFLLVVLLILSFRDHNQTSLHSFIRYIGIVHLNLISILSSSIFGFYFSPTSKWLILDSWPDHAYLFVIIASVLNILFMILCSLFSFNPSFGGLASRKPSSGIVLIIFSRSSYLIQGINEKLQTPVGNWMITCGLIVSELIILHIENKGSSYYNYRSSLIRGVFSSANISVLLISLIYTKLEVQTLSPLLLWILLFGIINQIVWANRKISGFAAFYGEKSNFSTEDSLSFHRLSYLIELLDSGTLTSLNTKQKPSENDLFIGFLMKKHTQFCQKSHCFHKLINGEPMEKCEKQVLDSTFKDFIESVIHSQFNQEIKINKFSMWLKLALAQRIISRDISQFSIVFNLLCSIPNHEKSVFVEISSKEINKKIDDYLQIANGDSKADLKMFIDYKRNQSKFKNLVRDNISLTISFWNEYYSEVPHLIKLFDISRRINSQDDKIRTEWAGLKSAYKDFAIHDYIFFASYLIITRNSETKGYELIKEYQNRIKPITPHLKTKQEITDETIIDLRNIMIHVSMEKSSLGVIKMVSGGTYDLLGYSHEELKGMKINLLMPDYISIHHDAYINQHLQSGKSKNLFKNRFLYAVNKLGYIRPIYLMICPSPNFYKSSEYICVIRPELNPSEFLLYNNAFEIVGCTSQLGKDLNISLNCNILRIYDICPLYLKVHKIISTWEWIAENLSIPTYEKLMIVLPEWLQKFQESKEDTFDFPKSEDEYNRMLDLYKKIRIEGLVLPFLIGSAQINYNCILSPKKANQNFKIYELRLYNISSSHIGFQTQNLKDILMSYNLEETILNPKKLQCAEIKSQHTTQKLQTRTYPSYLLKHVNIEPSIRSERSHSSISSPHKISKQVKNQRRASRQINVESISKIQGEDEEKKYLLPNSQTYFEKSVDEKVHQTYQDKNQIYFDLLELSKKMEGSSFKSGSKGKGYTKQIEMRINYPRSDKATLLMSCLSSLFFVGLIATLFIYTFYSKEKFEKANTLLESISASSNRINFLLQFNAEARQIDIFIQGHMTERSPGFINSTLNEAYRNLGYYLIRLKEISPIVVRSFSILSSEYLDQVLTPVKIAPVSDYVNTIMVPLEQAFSLFEALGLKIVENPDKIFPDEINEIIKSFPDDTLIRSETLVKVLLKNMKDLMDESQNFLEYFLIVQSIVTVMLLSYFVYVTSHQMRYRKGFFESLFKVEIKRLDPHVTRLKDFKEISQGSKEQALSKISINQQNANLPKGKIERPTRRNFDSSKLHFDSLRRIALQLGNYVVAFLAVLIFWKVVKRNTDSFYQSCLNIYENNHHLSEFILILTEMTSYVMDQNATLRNKPIKEEFWLDFNKLKTNQQFYLQLSVEGVVNPKILEIMQSNICERFQTEIDSEMNCTDFAGGSLRYGFIPLLSYILDTVENLLEVYDNTMKTNQDITNFFDQDVYYELLEIVLHAIKPPFESVTDIITQETYEISSTTKNLTWSINIIYLISALLLAIVSILITKRIKSEKLETQKMLNLIPMHIILDTPYIARFVKEDFL